MKTIYDAEYCSLHVRVGNRAAIALYKDVLGFEVINVDKQYYADGEDAYDMRCYLKGKSKKAGEVNKEEEEKENIKEEKALE